MAVYTHLGAEDLAELIAHYDVGELVSAKGIAEGVSNSNWLIETTGGADGGNRFILTMYERRIDISELPFFLGLLDHLAANNCPVPRTIHDRSGSASREIDGKAVALIEYLPGVSVDHPTASQARAVGIALAEMHRASKSYGKTRANGLDISMSLHTLQSCGEDALSAIDDDLPDMIAVAQDLRDAWPWDLPRSICHTDLFPDNVLMLGSRVTGMIDFYFACTDALAYDLAVCLNAWAFEDGGRDALDFNFSKGAALIAGYESVRPLDPVEREALPILCRGAAVRFFLTRLIDWSSTPEGALVKPKNPLEYANRLAFHRKVATAEGYGA